MVRRVPFLAVPVLLVLVLEGCALNLLGSGRREPWREQAENACMAPRPFRRDDAITPIRKINDHGMCGIARPLQITALQDGTVRVGPTATLGCPLTVALEQWLAASVQPAALARFGSPVVGIRQMSAYACRNVNGSARGDLSEHAFGNALDVAAFELADGRVITVLRGWSGSQAERDFLREVHATACQYFTTVLGPGVEQHGDHFHLDLAHHNANGTSRYCQPTPRMPAPARSPVLAYTAADGGGAAPAPPFAAAATPAVGPATIAGDIGALIIALDR